MAVAVSTEEEIELFLETLRLDAGISDFIANLGQDLGFVGAGPGFMPNAPGMPQGNQK